MKQMVRSVAALLLPSVIANTSGEGIQVESRSLVFEYPKRDPYDLSNLYCFNHAPSVVLLPDGRLLCVWFSAPFEASVHQVLLGAFSNDGKTWSKVRLLQDFPRKSDFDPAFVSDGRRVWLFFVAGRWHRYPFVRERGAEPVGPESYQLYSRISDDSGRTWSEPEAVKVERAFGCRTNGIRLRSGELLVPLHKLCGAETGVLKSADGGESWTRHGKISAPAGQSEPTIVELNSGRVFMFLRTTDGRVWCTMSKDKGETWSSPERRELVGANASHNLFHLHDGRILLTHDECPPPYRSPLTLWVSSDDGVTWSPHVTLAEVPVPVEGEAVWSRQVTYLSVAQLPDGTVVVVWAKIALSNEEQYGEIWSARVRID